MSVALAWEYQLSTTLNKLLKAMHQDNPGMRTFPYLPADTLPMLTNYDRLITTQLTRDGID